MKHCPHCGKEVRVDQDLCLNCGRYINRTNTQLTDKKTISFLLCLFGGFFGLHYFYEGNYKKGILYLLTAGIFMFGYIIDVFKYGIRLLKKMLAIQQKIMTLMLSSKNILFRIHM